MLNVTISYFSLPRRPRCQRSELDNGGIPAPGEPVSLAITIPKSFRQRTHAAAREGLFAFDFPTLSFFRNKVAFLRKNVKKTEKKDPEVAGNSFNSETSDFFSDPADYSSIIQ